MSTTCKVSRSVYQRGQRALWRTTHTYLRVYVCTRQEKTLIFIRLNGSLSWFLVIFQFPKSSVGTKPKTPEFKNQPF